MQTKQTNFLHAMSILRVGASFLWIVLSIAALVLGWKVYTEVESQLDTTLTEVSENVDILYRLLIETKDVISATSTFLSSAQEGLRDGSTALADARPLVEETSQVVTEDLPLALKGMQDSMPTLIDTASAVDRTLRLLSLVNLVIPNPFGEDLSLGLGIEYLPEVPLDEALENLNTNLEWIPEDLQGLKDNLEITKANLQTLSDDLTKLESDLGHVKQKVQDLTPQIEALAKNLLNIKTNLDHQRDDYQHALKIVQILYFGFWILILLGKIPETYIGWKKLPKGQKV